MSEPVVYIVVIKRKQDPSWSWPHSMIMGAFSTQAQAETAVAALIYEEQQDGSRVTADAMAFIRDNNLNVLIEINQRDLDRQPYCEHEVAS